MIRIPLKSLSLVALAATLAATLVLHPMASAASFNAHHIIDDAVFDNVNAMDTGSINSFLNGFSGSCISQNRGFTASDPTGYTPNGGYTYGGNVSAGQVINDSAKAYGINPQVLLATLQKEQSLVTGDAGCSTLRYAGSMGYGCPDSGTTHNYPSEGALAAPLYFINGNPVTSVSGTCVNSSLKVGFSQQVIRAAWLLKFGEQRSKGNISWNVQMTNSPQSGDNWDNSDDPQSCYSGPMTTGTYQVCPSGATTYYDGWRTIDGGAVHMETGGTASLYWYTPHLSGNTHFFDIFTSWFGVPYSNGNDYSFVTSSATGSRFDVGATGSATIVIKNTGYNTWYSDNNLPAGQHPTRLSTAGYQNSSFINPDSSSLFTRNQVVMTPDTVAPGSNATFTFNVAAPYQTINERLRLIPTVNGVFLRDSGISVPLASTAPYWTPLDSTVGGRDLLPNESTSAHFSIKNDSYTTWYSDGNVPAGKQSLRMATAGYENSPFADTSDPNWMGTRNQIKMNEASVAPGATATFDAKFIAPISSKAVANNFHFMLVSGGVFTDDKGLVFRFTVPAANLSFQATSVTNPPATMSPGSSATAVFTVKNTGNVIWQDEAFENGAHALRLIMSKPVYRTSAFYDSADSNWLTNGQVHKPVGTIAPGQSTTFSWSWKAPSQTGVYREPFQLAVGGLFYPDYGSAFSTTVQ